MERATISPLTPGQRSQASSRNTMGASPGATERSSSSAESSQKRKSLSSPPGNSRASPLRTGSSLLLEHTKRTAMEAQSHRTNVRLLELGIQEDEGVMAINNQGRQPDDLPLHAFPNTAAKKNVTVRRSRDRLSGEPKSQPKSPEEITNRLPKRRERDVRYSMESESDFRGATAITYRRQHGREFPAMTPGLGSDQMAGAPVHVNSDILPPPPLTTDEVVSTLRQEKDESSKDSRNRFHSR